MKERELFLAALDIEDPAARQSFLKLECAGDAALLARVESLLASHEGQSQFLNRPALEQIAEVSAEGAAATLLIGDDATQDDGPDPAAFKPHGPASMAAHQDDSDEEDTLGYLEPSSKPGSLGRLAHYEVLEVIGRGAFGTVLRAFDEKLQRVVAIKVMAPELAATSPARRRFLREAQASAAIRHENVVSVYAVEEKPLPYLVMEFIPGQTLQQRLDELGPLDVLSVVRLGRQIAEGLAAAHARDLIHRDIKPGNILLETGVHHRVKITDFGLARAADDASLTQSGTIAGTPMYMAPEQALGNKLDQRADLFSFGSVLYQMVSGRPPFRAPTALAVLKRVAHEPARPIPEIIPETPEWLCRIIAKLHAKNPEERFQSAREVADLLADCEAKLTAKQEVKNILPVSKPALRAVSPGRKWAMVAAAVVLLPLAALAATEFAGVTNLFRSKPAAVDPIAKKENTTGTQPHAKTAEEPTDVVAWERSVAAMVPTEQVQAVRARLMKLNPDFDGQVTPTINNGVVTGLRVATDHVTDISPVHALTDLHNLDINGSAAGKGSLKDLSPLAGLHLTHLNIGENKVSDLKPLAGMPLEWLAMWQWRGTDLRPLSGMPLKWLNCGGGGQKFDLATLAGLPLKFLCINHTKVSDLSPLEHVPLTELECCNTAVTDLSPLKGLRLNRINLTPKDITQGLDNLRDMKSLTAIRINGGQPWPSAEFWTRYDKGEFKE